MGVRLPTTTICIVFGSVAKWIALCTELKPRPFNISLSNLFCRSWHTADDSNAVHSGWGRSPLPGEAVRISAPSAVGLRARNRREMVPEERFELITVLFLRQTPPADWATRAKRSQRWPKGASAQAESIGFRDQLILKMIRGKNDRAGRVASLRQASRAVER